jgi:RNA polymerase sigma factor (sigma-70 family)
MDTFVKEHGVIRQPAYISRRRRILFRAANKFLTAHGKNPTDEELSMLTGMTMAKIVELRQLQRTNDNITDENELHDLPENDEETPVAIAEDIFVGLNEREELVIRLRNGFFDDKVFTLSEISIRLDISRERVRQLEARALDKLRDKKIKRHESA